MLLVFGQELNTARRPAEARALFLEFTRQFTNSTLLPEVRMAMARTCEIEGDWPAAIAVYDDVLRLSPVPSVAVEAEFHRALAFDQAGRDTNAFALMTNFLARHVSSDLAPRAQDWLGDFHFRREEFIEAERRYQPLYENTNWVRSGLGFMARLKAGRSAFMRENFNDATNYFLGLINEKQCPDAVVAQAFFAYGDTLMLRGPPTPDASNRLARFETAISVFRKIPQIYPTSPLAPRALGRIGDCYFQLAAQDARLYTNAFESYQAAMAAPLADAAVRSQAEIGLANCLARQAALRAPADDALLASARDHYLNVVYGRNLTGAETPVPLWVKEAGLAAARILESQKRWVEAIQLYGRMQQVIPALRPTLDRRIALAREQMNLRP